MTNKEIFEIALKQSATDLNCLPEHFLKTENVIVKSVANKGARKYLSLPFECNLVSYGSNIVASVNDGCAALVREYIELSDVEHCFETPNIYILNEKLAHFGLKVFFMAEYFLPDLNNIKIRECKYETRVINPEDFKNLYLPQWSNALCKERKALDVLAVGAYDKEKLVGLAGCSADCEKMWQIGVDVIKEYRGKGIASALVSKLALETLARGKVPFYCAAWCNVKSVRTALNCGFKPAWVEMTAKSRDYILKTLKNNIKK